MLDMITLLANDKEVRSLIRVVIMMLDRIDGQDIELEELREIGSKLREELSKSQTKYMELLKDKQALVAFIDEHVKDEEVLKKIFN